MTPKKDFITRSLSGWYRKVVVFLCNRFLLSYSVCGLLCDISQRKIIPFFVFKGQCEVLVAFAQPH